MALGRLIELLKDHPWRNYVIVNLVLIVLEKLVEQDFVCPCRSGYSGGFFFLYLVMPLLITLNFGVYMWNSDLWSESQSQGRWKRFCRCCGKFLTCAAPSVFWLFLFFGDGRFVACWKTPLKENHVDSIALPPWEWCDKNRTLTKEQYDVQTSFYDSKITVFSLISIIFFVALIYQCCRGCCEECQASRMETLPSLVHKVRCVVKRTVQRARQYDFSGDPVTVSESEIVALCSVCDGDKMYLITLKEDQTSELQEGETYIINNATVKEDHPVSEMILGNETGVFHTTPLQLDDNLIHRAKEIISPSSERAALNDPGLYLKQGYITLIGKVVSLGAPQQIEGDIPVRDVEIEEARVKVTVSLQKEAATEPLQPGQMIKITHLKVAKNKLCGKKLKSSDYTSVSGGERSRIKVVGFSTKDGSKVLLTEDQEKLSVSNEVWPVDADQLLQKLPVELLATRNGQEVTQVQMFISEKMERFPSSVCRVRCVVKRTVQRARKYDFSGDSVRISESKNVALCSVCDGTRIYLITLKEDQISKLQEGETYIMNNATVKEDHPVSEMILGNEAGVFRTAPLLLDDNLIRRAKEIISPSSERAALNDPGLYLKQGYITLTGNVVSPGAPQQTEGNIPVRDVEIEEDGVIVTVSLQKEAATKPLQPGQMIKITHLKVEKIQAHEKKLMSSDQTVISVLTDEPEEESLIKVVGFSTEDDELVLLTEDQEELSVAHRLSSEDADQLQRTLPVELKVTRRHKEVIKFLTALPSLDENLIHRMNESISRSSDRAALNDPVSAVSVQPQRSDGPEGSIGNVEESDPPEETSHLLERPSPPPPTSGMEMHDM